MGANIQLFLNINKNNSSIACQIQLEESKIQYSSKEQDNKDQKKNFKNRDKDNNSKLVNFIYKKKIKILKWSKKKIIKLKESTNWYQKNRNNRWKIEKWYSKEE